MRRVIWLLLMAILLCGCGGSEEKNVEETGKEENSDRATEVADLITNGGYIDVEKEYEKYISANENEEIKKYICTTGKIVGEETIKETKNFILEQDDGNKWAVTLTTEMNNAKPISDTIMNKRVKAYGYYYGILDSLKIPMMVMLVDDGFEIGEPALGKQKDYPRIEVESGGDKYETVWNFYEDWEKLEREENNAGIENQEAKTLEDFQEEEPFFSYSGTGDDIVSGAKTEATSYAHIIHTGDGHFSVKGHYGNDYDLLVNTVDPYDGTTLILPNQEYKFEVLAKGNWTIELYKIGTSSSDSFSGNGDCITPVFLKTSDVYEITTSGSGHFSVKGWTGSDYDLLVNTVDENYSGKIMFNSKEDYAFFEITASRDWEIKPSE